MPEVKTELEKAIEEVVNDFSFYKDSNIDDIIYWLDLETNINTKLINSNEFKRELERVIREL